MIRLAWRNIWRNGRRSALTAGSIAAGLTAVMTAQSVMKTVQSRLIEKTTAVWAGDIRIEPRAARNRRLPEITMARPAGLEAQLARDPRVSAVAARLLFTGLVYSAAGSRGVLIAGIEPDREPKVSIMDSYMTQGHPLSGRRGGAVLGDKLAGQLDLRLGEKLVILSQSANGEMNSELFRIAGIYHSGSESFDAQIIYVPLSAAQTIRGEPGRVSYLVARLRDFREASAVQGDFALEAAKANAAVATYREVAQEVVGIQKFEDAVLGLVMIVIFVIVGFGVLNTVSMSLFERLREFGVLRAIGAKPHALAAMVLLESVFLGSIGVACGLILGGAIIHFFGVFGLALPVGQAMSYWLPFDPVLYLKMFWPLHLESVAGLMLASFLAAIGPALMGARIRIAEALRHI